MGNRFDISLEWFPYSAGSETDRVFSAFIGLSADGRCLTRLDDRLGMTVRDRMYGCAWQLAQWFAANWWRLRWESGSRQSMRDNIDWGMSHSMASAGGGFIWPNIIFDSDGETIGIDLKPDTQPPPYEPVSYLNSVNTRIPASDFVQTIDGFLDSVLRRGEAIGVQDNEIDDLWREVLEERRDPEASRYRKWEAITGYDPDEAPEALLNGIAEASNLYGCCAAEEIAAIQRESLAILESLSSVPMQDSVCVVLPSREDLGISPDGTASEPPWAKAERLAACVRQKLDLGTASVPDKTLADMIGASAEMFSEGNVAKVAMPFALREAQGTASRLFLTRKPATSRRFAVSRLIGDQFRFGGQERLLPATDTQTFRQKFQRAFAQAFLCPFDALQDKLGTKTPDDDDIADAAEYFQVSPLLVRNVLVNKGVLERDGLNQQAG